MAGASFFSSLYMLFDQKHTGNKDPYVVSADGFDLRRINVTELQPKERRMYCPDCKVPLYATEYLGVRVDECPECLGRWFDRDELRRAKDHADPDLRWLDFDVFAGEPSDPQACAKGRDCPRDLVKMGVVVYERSGVCVDKCGQCLGVWLDHGEFEKIVKHLEMAVDAETAAQYREEAKKQLAQVFKGPGGPLSELRDFFAVMHLLKTRVGVEQSGLANALNTIWVINPFK
jgi:Zn-finger nucleic acid-binding protein